MRLTTLCTKEYNHIVDDLATIDVNDIQTDNTLGIEAEHTVNSHGYKGSYMQELEFLTLADFTGDRLG